MSDFDIVEFFPAFKRDWPNFFADDIVIFSNALSFTLSLKEKPIGDDMFITGLTLPFCGTILTGLHLKPFIGGKTNGPATKPASIQSAIVSANSAPYVVAESEFLQLKGGKFFT